MHRWVKSSSHSYEVPGNNAMSGSFFRNGLCLNIYHRFCSLLIHTELMSVPSWSASTASCCFTTRLCTAATAPASPSAACWACPSSSTQTPAAHCGSAPVCSVSEILQNAGFCHNDWLMIKIIFAGLFPRPLHRDVRPACNHFRWQQRSPVWQWLLHPGQLAQTDDNWHCGEMSN